MLHRVTIGFAGDRIDLKVAKPYIHRVEANLVAVERIASNPKDGPMVLAIGESARSLVADADARVVLAYDPHAFEPELAGAVIGYYRAMLFQEARPRLREMFTIGLFDRSRIDLLMPRYEQLPADARHRFVNSLGMAWHRSEIFVNNRQLPKPTARR